VLTEEGLAQARTLTQLFFQSDVSALKTDAVLSALRGDSRLVRLPRAELLQLSVAKLAARHHLVDSGGKARRLVEQGGLFVNGTRVDNVADIIKEKALVDGRIAVLRAGKDKHTVLVLDDDALLL
jgi:tyrosyl-tRNA synthetase